MALTHTAFVRWIACLVSIGGILYGYDIGVISGALLFVQKVIPMTDAEVSVIVGAVLAGGLIGTLVVGPLADKYGRRFAIALAGVIFIIGVILIVIASSFWMLLGARLFLGIGVGVVAVAVPLYVAEIVPSKDRGKYMTLFQLLLTFGIVLAYFVDLAFTPSGNWRGMFAVLLIPSAILFFGILSLPESPRWLMANNQIDKAKSILFRTRSHAEAELDIKAIQNDINETQGSWSEFLTPRLLLPFLVALSIAIFNQLTGINSFLQYAPLILKNAGISSDLVSMIGSAGIGLLNFICTLVAISLVDVVGRRPLLLIGVAGVVLSEIYLGIVNHIALAAQTQGMLSLLGLLGFILFFAIGPGVVVWLAISELFPTKVRGKGISICLFFNSLASTALASCFLPLVKHIGMDYTYWLFAVFTMGYFFVAWFGLPETKGKTLEQIQMGFSE